MRNVTCSDPDLLLFFLINRSSLKCKMLKFIHIHVLVQVPSKLSMLLGIHRRNQCLTYVKPIPLFITEERRLRLLYSNFALNYKVLHVLYTMHGTNMHTCRCL